MTQTYVDNQKLLNDVCKEIEQCDQVGLDTEFMRESTYAPKLCLIQLIVDERVLCIDPMALDHLDPFYEAINHAGRTKILHSARQDLEVFYRSSGLVIGPIFDTQVAAAFLGHRSQIGYATLVQELVGVELKKDQTRTNWARRPLKPAQIDYALDDVRYLPQLTSALVALLKEQGKDQWALSAMQELTSPEALMASLEYPVERLKGFKRLKPREKAIARAMVEWREKKAKETDRPRRWILDDKQICLFAHQKFDGTLERIEDTIRNNKATGHSYAKEIHEQLHSPQLESSAPEAPADFGRRPSASEEKRIKELSQAVSEYAQEVGIAQDLLATQKELANYVLGLSTARFQSGWRAEGLGSRIKTIEEGSM